MNEVQQTMFGFSMPSGQIRAQGAEIALSPMEGPRFGGDPAELATRPPLPEMPYGTGACYCTTCLQMFRSEAGFDAHRVGNYPTPDHPTNTRRCLTVAEMVERGMVQNAKAQWVTKAYDGPHRAEAPDAE